MKHSEPTYYEALGVPPSATADEIREAYWTLALKHHPDLPRNQGKSEEQFKHITFAYGVLKDPRRRREFDEMLSMTRHECAHCAGKGRVFRSKGFTGKVYSPCPKCKGVGYA